MRLLFTFFVCVAAALSSQAQERVRNVRVRVVDSAQLEIRYDLINTRVGDSVYLNVVSRQRGALRISPEFVRGDLGVRITAGSDRRIIWNALANGYSLNEEIQARVLVKTGASMTVANTVQPTPTAPVVVQQPAVPVTTPGAEAVPPKASPREKIAATAKKNVAPTPEPTPRPTRTNRKKTSVFATDSVSSQPAPAVVSTPAPQHKAPETQPLTPPTAPRQAVAPIDSMRPRRSRYAGPAWAFVSAVAPGIGNIFVQTPKPKIGLRPLLTVGCYGLLVYGFSERQKSKDDYALYEQQKNMAAGDPYYTRANDHHHTYFMATRGAFVVAAADVVLTFIKGLRNSQLQKEARRYQSVTLSPSLQAGQPTALVRFSF